MMLREENDEYNDKCFDIFKNGGILYLIERTDTNEFLYMRLDQCFNNSNQRLEAWSKNISFFTKFFLSKEDAIEETKCLNLTKGGCYCCGHGSIQLPIEITEHEFVSKDECVRTKK